MAQGAVASFPINGAAAGPVPTTSLTADELHELQEYERIVQFKDAVLAGIHPRVKIAPHHLNHIIKQVYSARNAPISSVSTPQSNAPVQLSHSTPDVHSDISTNPVDTKSPINRGLPTTSHVAKSSRSEINPILLEKSDDLIKAEIQLQRQRLERGLREQIEQQRIMTKALLQTSESLPNFDLSEVLSKALALVHPSSKADVEPSVGARSSASDSFDENTFYSSQHDTPEVSSSSQGQKEPGEIESFVATPRDNRPSDFHSVQDRVAGQDVAVMANSHLIDDTIASQARLQTHVLPAPHQSSATQIHLQISDSSDSSSSRGGNHSAGRSTHVDQQVQGDFNANVPHSTIINGGSTDNRTVVQKTNDELLKQAFEDTRGSPLIRAHNLSPLAPQPARVSPLATAREPPILREHNLADEAQPLQVAALRNMGSGISSADSSPRGGKGSERRKERKEKKKKRKAKDNSVPSPDSPYIKPEPQSPSLFAVAPLPRPQKRQRQSGQFAAELNYDEPRPSTSGYQQERVHEPTKIVRSPPQYIRYERQYDAEPAYRRTERDDDGYRRISGGQLVRRAQSPVPYAVPYPSSDIRSVRATSQTITEGRFHEEPRYYTETLPRASVRPDADRERSRSPVIRDRRSPILMAPPRKPMRIVVDEFGNEYIDPTPTTFVRQSMAPPTRYRDPEIMYERAAPRPLDTHVAGGAFRVEPTYRQSPLPARRVVTQPEYVPVPSDYRSYRQREYSTVAVGDEYVQRLPERRHVSHYEGPPREYSRAPSVRPEAVRYEIPREYAPRHQSVRPEAPPREYAASVYPESRSEMIVQPQREYSVRPVEGMPRREPLVVSEGERYYEERRPAEVTYIERPRMREASVMIYPDGARREVYR